MFELCCKQKGGLFSLYTCTYILGVPLLSSVSPPFRYFRHNMRNCTIEGDVLHLKKTPILFCITVLKCLRNGYKWLSRITQNWKLLVLLFRMPRLVRWLSVQWDLPCEAAACIGIQQNAIWHALLSSDIQNTNKPCWLVSLPNAETQKPRFPHTANADPGPVFVLGGMDSNGSERLGHCCWINPDVQWQNSFLFLVRIKTTNINSHLL